MASKNSSNLRSASHAGSWYTGDGSILNDELNGWLSAVTLDEPYPIQGCKAVIAPHAGYTYSGPAAAWAYKSIDTKSIKRVFILGPVAHCQGCEEYETPIGNLPLDLDKLRATNQFEALAQEDDEAEHSLEMHLPYVRKMFEGKDISIVPIVVGSVSKEDEAAYGALLAPYLDREDTFCVISSDFCHWGTRFSYTFYYPSSTPGTAGVRLTRSLTTSANPIHTSIGQLDHEAMDILTLPPAEAHTEFAAYLSKTRNTICGRHPIGVLLGAMTALGKESRLKWVRYEQSSACETLRDSSVSYASAWVTF
ncbi:MEMO1 family [Armillaria luteobubalina]|uniref:MEMO1 family n=1 Tax=Armillaria luteobubalina TaxID=153913 RepID=A0AA39QND5_9AGAR|nr:MEMO1 family [Armillaria luteobubalina]